MRHPDPWFLGIVFFMVALNLLCAGLQVGLLRRRGNSPRWLEAALVVWALLMCGLLFVQCFAPPEWEPVLRHYFYLPLGVGMIWNLLFLQVMVLVLIVTTLILRRFSPVQKTASLSPEGMSRRRFLYLTAFGAAPVTALGMGVHGAVTRHDLRVRELAIPVTGLPPSLEGFKIAHVSDLHSGIFCGPSRLRIIRDATNDLKADLVAITGDIINREMAEFAPVLQAIQSMQSRHGTFLCEGNHDRIPGPNLVVRACAANKLPMLFNQSAYLPVEDGRLIIGGLPWMKLGFETHPEIVSNLFPERKEGDVRILMAHHPHLFDIAQSTDLVLAGHTHGGQLMLGEEVGFGPLFFKYWSGLYRRGKTSLVVSNGCGDWFPCRIGAPAEVGLLRLTRAA